VLLGSAALVLLVSACGSTGSPSARTSSEPSSSSAPATTQQPATDGSTPAPASTDQPATDGSAPQVGGRGGQMHEVITAFTACLGEHGVTVPDISIPEGRGNGQPPFDGSRPGTRPDGSVPAGATPGSFPRRNGGGAGFDPGQMIVRRLGLDTSDATVEAAVAACSSTLTAAFPNRGQATTTTTTG
jgi:hypothetical protein